MKCNTCANWGGSAQALRGDEAEDFEKDHPGRKSDFRECVTLGDAVFVPVSNEYGCDMPLAGYPFTPSSFGCLLYKEKT